MVDDQVHLAISTSGYSSRYSDSTDSYLLIEAIKLDYNELCPIDFDYSNAFFFLNLIKYAKETARVIKKHNTPTTMIIIKV